MKGVIINLHEKNEDHYPEVEYTYKGKSRCFHSKYSGGTVGSEVSIVYNSKSGKAEVFHRAHRWGFTLVPLLIGGLGLYLMLFG